MTHQPVRVAVSGVSGDVGLGTVRALREPFPAPAIDVWLLGLDSDDECPAFALCDAHQQLPRVDDPAYVDRLIKVLNDHRIATYFPGVDSEVPLLAHHREAIEVATGTTLVIAPRELVDAAADKLLTADYLAAHGLPSPQTWDVSDSTAVAHALKTLPLIAKPRVGQGSRGVHLLETDQDVEAFLATNPDGYVLQEYIEGPEITVGILTDECGALVDHIAMERSLEDGRTVRGSVIVDARVDALVHDFVSRVPCAWAVNLQLRLHPERGPMVFEINARLSGSTGMRVAVGFNDPARILERVHAAGPMAKARVPRTVTVRRGEPLRDALNRATSIVFDCGDTLLALNPSREELFARAAGSIGLDLTADLRSGRITDAYDTVHQSIQMRSSELTRAEAKANFYATLNGALCEVLGIADHFDELHPALLSTFMANRNWQPLPGVPDALSRAAETKRLYVLANWDRDLIDLLSRLNLRRHFSAVVSSEELGVEKPSRDAYERFVRITDVVPESSLYVGNEYVADIVGSRQVGFTPVLYDPKQNASPTMDVIRFTSWSEFMTTEK